MAIYLAPVGMDVESQRIGELLRGSNGTCVRVSPLGAERSSAPGHIHLRIAATDATGIVLGYGDVGHDPSAPQGCFWFDIVVDSAARRRGVGSMLYEDIVLFAREQGATSLEIRIRDDAYAGLRFAARRGFTVESHESSQQVEVGAAVAGGQDHPYRARAGAYRFVLDLD